MGRFKPELQQWWATEFLPGYEKLTAYHLGEGTKLKAWHLQTLATAPKYQKKGVGRALVEIIKQKAQEEGKVICLETDTPVNVEIYKKLGFAPQKEPLTIKGLTGSFQMWSLLIEPKSAA
ncbi:hypothetical protein NMY22_g18629 [Coprinellus aureogranulatus]|nr:hypothetical protein NMY22_g18629 [Coprinellus aureogranulatus]